MFLDDPEHASPYSPASRLLLNILNIDVMAVPELENCAPAMEMMASHSFRDRVETCRAAHLVDYADDIDPTWLEGVTTVGVTSGASVPEVLVRGVLERLAEHGYDVVQPVTTANETLVFALPREIRPARGG